MGKGGGIRNRIDGFNQFTPGKLPGHINRQKLILKFIKVRGKFYPLKRIAGEKSFSLHMVIGVNFPIVKIEHLGICRALGVG